MGCAKRRRRQREYRHRGKRRQVEATRTGFSKLQWGRLRERKFGEAGLEASLALPTAVV